jgi:hypothetical protein
MSSVLSPKIIPVKPPVIKVDTKPIANNMVKLQITAVVIKLKALTAKE